MVYDRPEVIGGESCLDFELFHQDERGAVNQGPGFVRSGFAEVPGRLVEFCVNANSGNVRI